MKLHAARLLLPLAAGALFAATPAYADTITLDSSSIGNSYTLNYNGFIDSTVVNGLAAATTFVLTGISGNQYFFDYSITNTTSNPVDSRVSGFGFNSNPDITAAQSTGAFSYTSLGGNYPNGIGNVDVCFKAANTGSCAGGGGGGITDGQTGTGSFVLSFANAVSSLTLGDFYVRYQSVSGAGNVSSASGIGTLTSSGGTSVPAPGAMGLLAGGLFALGMILHRKRKVALAPAA